MKTLKSIIAVCTLLALCAISALAQQYTVTTLVGGTNTVNYGGTTNYNQSIGLGKFDQVSAMISFKLTGTGTGNVIAKLEKSVDGTLWDTVTPILWTNVATSATTVTAVSNITMGAVGYLRLVSIENADDAERATNLVFSVGVKPQLVP